VSTAVPSHVRNSPALIGLLLLLGAFAALAAEDADLARAARR